MIVITLRAGGGLNDREHWRQRAKRVKKERELVAWALCVRDKPALPCVVRLTRCGPSNGLDDDNLSGSLKAVRDEIAKWLGVDDRHSKTVRYVYDQARGKEWSVRVEFRPMETA